MNAQSTVPEIETSENQAAANRCYREIINQTPEAAEVVKALEKIDTAIALLNEAEAILSQKKKTAGLVDSQHWYAFFDSWQSLCEKRSALLETVAGLIALRS